MEGQVRIDNTCIDNFSIEISNNASMDVTSAPTDEYNEPNREFDDNELDLYNDRTRHPNTYLRIKTDNKFQAKLVEKWLFAGVKEEKVNKKGGYIPPEGAVDVNLLEFSSNGIEFLKKQEGVITHVYNDAKGGSSKYCFEHKNHSNSDWFCTENNHYVTVKDKNGNKKDVLGKPTIGLGHLITSETELQQYCSVKESIQLSKEDCWKLFSDVDLPKYETLLRAAIEVKITQTQYDALLSFVFNTGTGNLKKRGVFKNINSNSFDAEDMKKAFMQWKSPAIVIPRREDEINLFNIGKFTFKGNEIK